DVFSLSCFFLLRCPPTTATLFPYTTLFRSQQKPLGTRTAERHSHTPSVHDSHPAHLPVELHVGMAADDQGYAQSRENRQSRLSGVKRVKHSFSFRGVAWQ